MLVLATTAAVATASTPTLQMVQPAPGTVTALTQITVTFSEPVTNVVATDLLANDGPAADVTGSGAVYTFTLDRQPDYGPVQITWDPSHGIVDLEQPPNRFDENAPGSTWQYNLIDTAPPIVAELSPPDGVGVRSLIQIEVFFSEPVAGVDAADLLINGLPASGIALLGAGKYRFTFPQPASGTVQVSWAGNHGIHDLAPTPNNFADGAWSYTLDPNLGVPLIRINEFLAANVSGLMDENGEAQDWIEIWNYGTNSVNLAGYSLSDDAEDPGRWTFPSTNLGPGRFLVLFASAKDRKTVTSVTNRLHTNFRLNPNGEYLGLFTAELPRVAITEFAPEFPEQRNNYSYGYDGSNSLRYFAVPTPGGSNSASAILGILPPPHFNVQRGYFDTPFTLILSPLSGATIRYTSDGSEPTLTNGSTYVASLTISNTTVFRAATFKTNALPSLTVTHTYLFLDQVINQPSRPSGFPTNWGTNIQDVGTATFPPASTTPGLVPADYAMDLDPVRVDPNNTNSPIDAVKLQRLKDGLRELPTVSIVMKTDDIFGTAGLYQRSADETGTPGTKPENKKPCSVEMILPDGTTAFATTCGIDLHGNASRNPLKNPKHGFKLNFRTDFGPTTLQYRLFEDSPVEEFDDVLLRPDFNSSWRHWSDTAGQGLGAFQRTRATRTRDAWMKDAMRAMGGVASHNRFCHLYLNGLYWGTFEFSEDPTQVFAKNTLGGTEEDFDIYDQGLLKAGTATAYNAMVALPAATTLAQYDQYKQYLNLPEFIDYMVLHFFMGHHDWATNVTKNWYAIRKRVPGPEGTFRYIPWDGECILLNEDFNRVNVTTPPSGLHTKLDDSPEYRLAFADRVHRHMIAPGAALTPAANIARWQKWQAVMDKAIVAESARWGDYRRDVHQYSEGTYQLYTRENHWLPENNRMLGYFSNRNAIVLGHLRAANLYPAVSPPSFSQQGGVVARGFNLTMTATNTIYYTLDGSDPRVYGTGGVSSNADTYTGAITLSNTVVVKARALFGTTWSALNEANFIVDALAAPLRITEIMYNPMGGDAYEFLELQNVSSAVLNVSSWSIDGIDYVFPSSTFLQPGQIIVLGSDASPGNWTNRYPGVSVFGRFSGRLDNGGEKLSIKNASGQMLWSVDYDDANGWPASADGAGYSLQIIDVFGDPDDPANWRASAAANGTPGTVPPSPPVGVVVLNEVMADNVSAVSNGGFYSDWVELHNTSASPVSLANWSLTDDSNPRKFVFPSGSSVAANGYLVIWCDTNALVPGLRAPFGLGRNGDSVFLYDANTNRVDAIGFGLQLTNLTIGRVGPASAGWTLTQPTPNAANIAIALAPVTDLVINEWLANAVPGGDDWVELHNRSTIAPASLAGIYLGTSNTTYQLTALSFIAPGGYVQLLADENPGANHLDFRLPAEGGAIALYDELGQELDRVTYGPQAQGVTQGRLPDGTPTVMSFPASPSPAASNYLLSYSGPRLNEVLAVNRAAVTNASRRTADFVELWNTNGAPFDLSGMHLSNDPEETGQWAFPTGTVVAANSYVVVWFDDEMPASTTAGAFLNTGHSLDGESGEVWLFNGGGQPVDSVVFGFQVADRPIGRAAGGPWALLSSATPGAANAGPVALGSAAALRFNEWLANPSDGDDWFEIYNSSSQPVELSGLFVSDSPAATALMEFSFPPLSFIGANGFVKCVADGHPSNGRDHVNFSLAGEGEALRLYSASLGFMDTIYFGLQRPGVSQGRLPDGGASIVDFPESPTPAESNYLPIPNAVISEALSHTDAPLEDAIEIHNPTATPVDISGWYLSDSQDNFQKYRITTGAIAAQGFVVFYENQLNGGAGSLVPFTLDSSRGDEAWLSAADGMGNLTGYRAGVKFGAAANGISFGRYKTTVAVDFPAQGQGTLGATNSTPKVGPIVINEIMYHPPDIAGTNDNLTDEFVELYNLTTNAVPLFDPAATTNTWHLRGALSFNFPPGSALPSRGFLLVVSFNPSNNPATLAAFRSKYGLPATVPIYGPYNGKLDNGGENIELFKPDPPQGPGPEEGFVPYVLVDRVNYDDTAPWPFGADGGGASLQRRRPFEYGNDPVNWKAEGPTAGRPNVPGSTYVDADRDGMSDGWENTNGLNSSAIVDENQDADSDGQTNYEEFLGGTNPQNAQSRNYVPAITGHPQDQTVLGGATVIFTAAATGSTPLIYQWRFNGKDLPGEIGTNLVLGDVQGEHAGNYDVVVINEGGFVISQSAKLVVNYLPRITVQPQSQIVNTGVTVTLNVVASGTGPLRYRWRLDGADIPMATNSSLIITTNAGLAHNGDYSVVVTDDIGPVTSDLATLIVRVAPVITQHPASQTVAIGSTVAFTVNATGTRPMGYRWRRGGLSFVFNEGVPSLTLTNVQLTNGNTYNVIVTNIANAQGVPSTNAHLVVVAPPTNQVTNPGHTVTFIAAAGGPPPLRYQWQFNGTNLLKATNTTLMVTNAQVWHEGIYTFIVTNGYGTPASFPATLHVQGLASPQLVDGDQTNAVLSFNAVSNQSYSVLWRESLDAGRWAKLADVDAQPFARVETTVDPMPRADGRLYRIVTPQEAGPINPMPAILTSPKSVVASVGDEVTFRVFAVGDGSLAYRWTFDGNVISGVTASNLVITNVQFTNIGNYAVTVTDSNGSLMSDTVHLSVKPRILMQPQAQTARLGQSVVFNVSAEGMGPLTHRWRWNNRLLAGQTSATLTLTNLQTTNSGRYAVSVSHELPWGWFGVVSSNALLTVQE